jgi:His/Glu/Gln/Arg/opine family amino acid ABC transporter permease subunit
MDFGFLAPYAGLLAQATGITIVLSFAALALGVVLGALIALLRLLSPVVLNRVFGFAVGFIRGTPMIVQILAWYLVPQAIGAPITPFVAACVGLGVNAAAFISEILRGAILAIPRGQREAAVSYGLSTTYSIVAIELPQAAPAIVPAMMGFFISLVKDTSLAYVVGLYELTRTGRVIADREFQPMEVYIVIAAIYFLLCFPLSRIVKTVDKRLQQRGLAQASLAV